MKLKRFLTSTMVQVILMAIAWEMMESDLMPWGQDFAGKIVICLLIMFVSKIVGFMMGG